MLYPAWILPVMACTLTAQVSSATDDTLCIENDALRVTLDAHTGAFLSVFNKIASLELLTAPDASLPPWELERGAKDGQDECIETVRDAETFSATWDETYAHGQTLECRWKLSGGHTIVTRMELPKGKAPLRIYPAVLDGDPDMVVVNLRYPIIRGIGRLVETTQDNYLAHPIASGFLFEDPYALFQEEPRRGMYHCVYPNGFSATMQFMEYYAKDLGGFYFACEDPFNTYKHVDFHAPSNQAYLEAAFAHFSWDMHLGNELRLGYPVVLAALTEGNWYEGAALYRDWATTPGPRHPNWCSKGLLEERVARGEASKWLSEDVGYCTFGMPSSIDVSDWLKAFHEAGDGPVFHIFGHDWPKWADDPAKHGRLQVAAKALGLPPLNTLVPRTPRVVVEALRASSEAAKGLSGDEAVRAFMDKLYSFDSSKEGQDYPMEAARMVYQEVEWLLKQDSVERASEPVPWSPSIMHQSNIDILQQQGDHYALFEFDCFPYGYDLSEYGIIDNRDGVLNFPVPGTTSFAHNWTDPGYTPWRDFHAARDAQATRDTGADADYYDVSSAAVPQSLFSNRIDRLDRPMGYGRNLIREYQELYENTKEATRDASGGQYVPQGSEVMTEVYMGQMDYAQCRAGGGVQSDMEGTQFLASTKEGRSIRIPLFTYVYHAYGTVKIDGWAKLAPKFGDIFYLIAAQVALEGGLLELNYEFSPLELFPGMAPPSYQLHYHAWIETIEDPLPVDEQKVVFLKEITQARTDFAKDFLCYGTMVPSASVTIDTPALSLAWDHYNSIVQRSESGVFEAPTVVHYGWQYRDEKVGYILCNIDTKSHDATVTLDLVGTCLEGQRVTLDRVTAKKRKRLGFMDNAKSSFEVELPPRTIVLIEARPRHRT